MFICSVLTQKLTDSVLPNSSQQSTQQSSRLVPNYNVLIKIKNNDCVLMTVPLVLLFSRTNNLYD